MPKIPVVSKKISRSGVDTETTGVDLHHGATPFMVSVWNGSENLFWETDVNPETRMPNWSAEDIEEIKAELAKPDELILQNAKFDVKGLSNIDEEIGINWRWEDTRDTLLGGHLLASNQPHDLTSMVLIYCRANIQPYEDAVRECTNEARRIARSKYPTWLIAKEGLPMMPSVQSSSKKKLARGGESESPWKNDMWLCREIAKAEGYPKEHRYWTVVSQYCNMDTCSVTHLYENMEETLKNQGLWEIYLERLKILPIVYGMERVGITLNKKKLEELHAEYTIESKQLGEACLSIAKDYDYELELPKSGVNNSLRGFLWTEAGLNLPIVKFTKKTKNKKSDTNNPSFDKGAKAEYLSLLEEGTSAHTFIQSLGDKSSRDVALSYMSSYRDFWIPVEGVFNPNGEQLWYRLHPSLNSTGTDTLRFSSQNPNEQNISKKKGFNLRYMFGPLPGREWWACDASNIELRIPAYEANEELMIQLFERPNDPPYYGSNHLLFAHLLHEKVFEDASYSPDVEGHLDGRLFKEKYDSTLYQWTKNGNFAVQYGAMAESGTADRAYHVVGGQAKIESKLTNIKKLSQRMISFAQEHGYVETIPDKTVNPNRGYPLWCARSNYGKVSPTVPLSYHVQGTAMWWMCKAMIRCQEYLDELNSRPNSPGYHMIMQVHDELIMDFPKGRGETPWKTNLPKMRKIQQLMSMSGDDIGIPTPTSCKYHSNNWSEGISL